MPAVLEHDGERLTGYRSERIIGRMPLPLPFLGVDARTAWLRGILLAACFFGLLACAPLWFNSRAFPLSPIAKWVPILPSPLDKVLFGTMLLALLLALWRYHSAVIFFCVAALFAFCEDQNRGQPWLYMYWVMLWLTLFPARVSISACRVALSAAYFWSGVQKLNLRFFHVAPDWFANPAIHWHLGSVLAFVMHWAVMVSPFWEVAIGLALWVPSLRRAAIVSVFVLHLGALLVLGPLGYNYNLVVWPWNLAMIALAWALFSRTVHRKEKDLATTPAPTVSHAFKELRRSKAALAVLALYSLLPCLSFYGMWDSDFSFSLYSENQAVANLFVTEDFKKQLPSALQEYVQPFSPTYDPQHQGPYIFGFQTWCYKELRVPPIPEPRNYRAIYSFLRSYAKEPRDLRLLVSPRSGPVLFYEGEQCMELQRAK